MKRNDLPVRRIEGPASWRSRMPSALRRMALREPLDPEAAPAIDQLVRFVAAHTGWAPA